MTDVDILGQSSLFAEVSVEEIASILSEGEVVTFQKGDLLFTEGSAATNFYILLDGHIQITKRLNGQDVVIAEHVEPGAFSGEIPLLTGTPYVATARAVQRTRCARFGVDAFQHMLVSCSPVTKAVLPTLASRIRSMEILTMQQEKLAALGKLSAGLAHELNNPAAAAQRGAAQLRETLLALQKMHFSLQSNASTVEVLTTFYDDAVQHAARPLSLDPLEQSDRADELASWLESHNIADGYELAPTFVESGLDNTWCEQLAQKVPNEILQDFIPLLEKTLQVFGLLNSVEQSTGRISTLVQAVKDYSYMDQAPLQEVNIHEGLENTLTILHHKLNSIKVIREYDTNLPHISGYGSELNQVWTNLLDNAGDALEDVEQEKYIRLRTYRDYESLLIEIADNGTGIPSTVQQHIFEPFYTTKGVGKGTGLGLDIVYRIVVGRHHGEIHVVSQPGATCFTVRLPIQQPA